VTALNKAKRIFGIRLPGGKRPTDTGDGTLRRRRRVPAGDTKWRRTATLALIAGLFFVMAAETGLRAVSNSAHRSTSAVPENPLSLFAGRSPGARGSGPLRLTKSGPHERVLASVRERAPQTTETPVSGTSPNTASGPAPAANAVSRPLAVGRAPFAPVFYDTPIGYPGTPGGPATPPGGGTPPAIGAPEPAAWTLVAFGWLAVAGSLRRRRRKRA
jgi:hypothetical protein